MSVPAWFARNVFRLQEAAMHRPTFPMLEELERTQWLSRDDMLDYQTGHLNVLLQTALAHSPWHAARLHAAGLVETVRAGAVLPSDLSRLPTMDKRDARENVEQLVWRGVPGGVFPYTTGGSSGEPLIFHFGRARQAADAAGRLRARRWWGVAPGEREVYLWGAPVELSKTDRIKTLRDRLVNQLLLNAFDMSPACMGDYLEAIQAWNPKAIYGYASSLALLAAHAETRGARLRLPALRVVSTTGEPLFPHQRELIEQIVLEPEDDFLGTRDIVRAAVVVSDPLRVVGRAAVAARCPELAAELVVLVVGDRQHGPLVERIGPHPDVAGQVSERERVGSAVAVADVDDAFHGA